MSNEDWSGHCYKNKRECNLNHLNAGYFVEQVAKNNSGNNGNLHKLKKFSWLIALFSL